VYLKVLALTGIALGLSLVLERWIEPDFSPLFLGAVALSTRRWGKRAGIVSALITIPALVILFLPPHYTLRFPSWPVALRLLSFLLTAALIVWLAEKFLSVQKRLVRSLEEVRTREERFRVALLKSPVVVFHQNTELRYIWVYNPFPEHTDVSLLNKLDSDLFPAAEAEQLTRIKRAVLTSGKGAREEVVVTGGGCRRTMDLSIEPFKDCDGNTVGLLGTAVDITEQKIHEEHLKHSGEQFRSLAWHLHSTHEDQRALTSREIHDKVSQMLAALDLELATIGRMMEGGDDRKVICDRLRAMGASLSTTIATSVRISSDLRPSLLDNLGLASAIEAEAREFQARTGVSVVTSHLEPAALSPDIATAVFRIVQEMLAGIESHSDATFVTISLRKGFAGLVLQMRDNGRGKTADEGTDSESLRLLSMREMATAFGGKITLQGIQGRGTTLWVEIPVRRAAEVPESCEQSSAQ
jgi:signal transduction histidine kinase